MNLPLGQPMSNFPPYTPGMKMNCIINPARILITFGHAWLINRADGRQELVGGSDQDCTEAKEWVSLFAHETVFSRPMKGRPHVNFALAPIPV
jgi:hypothetical protein